MSSSENDAEAFEDSNVRVLFGRRIRELRKAKGYSQERFAMVSGLDRSYYGSVERGERNVSLDNISAIAKALDEPIYKLFVET
ncbi:MAG: helix-turn-helix transcriptional regulator [Rubrobacteraceae bacterium]